MHNTPREGNQNQYHYQLPRVVQISKTDQLMKVSLCHKLTYQIHQFILIYIIDAHKSYSKIIGPYNIYSKTKILSSSHIRYQIKETITIYKSILKTTDKRRKARARDLLPLPWVPQSYFQIPKSIDNLESQLVGIWPILCYYMIDSLLLTVFVNV